jgi:hypothetical protein
LGFDVTDQTLITFSLFVRYRSRNGSTVHQLFIDFRKAYDSVRRKVGMSKVRILSICLLVFLSRMV